MTASPFDHPFLSGLLGDEEIGRYFTAEADIRAMLSFEAALAKAEAAHGVVPQEAALRIAQVCGVFDPDMESLRSTTKIDGVVVPGLVKQLREAIGGDAAAFVHFGATSQDVIDTSLMIRLQPVASLLSGRLVNITGSLKVLEDTFGPDAFMAHTRMQGAIPITVADRLQSWRRPLEGYWTRLTELTFPIQFGGAAGTLDKLGTQAADVRASLAQELGLMDEPQWQTQRAWIVDFANLLSLIAGSIGKIGQDVALLAFQGSEIELEGGGASSAMPHKRNPIVPETLVALARFNATQISGLHQSMVHEQDRSGAAWTLEWMILPLMIAATAASLRLAADLSANIRRLGNGLPTR